MVRIENWSVCRGSDDIYKSPERVGIRLQGQVFGHPEFTDGEAITTSLVVGSTGLIVHCESRDYQLGTVDPAFLNWVREQGLPYDPLQPVKIITSTEPMDELPQGNSPE